MPKDNIAFFRKAVEKDPTNSFARYSLAMEYRKTDRLAEALATFAEVIDHDPSYIAAFQMAAQTAFELGEDDRARAILKSGIDAARIAGNDHAASEMNEFLQSL